MIEIYNVLMVLLMIMQKMQGLRHRKLTSKKDAIRGGSNQTGSTERSIAAAGKSKRANTKRVGAHTGSSERLMMVTLEGSMLMVWTPQWLEAPTVNTLRGAVLMV